MLARGTFLGLGLVLILTACVGDSPIIDAGGGDAVTPQGSEGGACFPNGTCNTGLVCSLVNGTGVCTQVDAASDVADAGTPSDSGSPDAGDAGCTPKDCIQQGFNCGIAGDTCGNTLNCGSCTQPLNCDANVCK